MSVLKLNRVTLKAEPLRLNTVRFCSNKPFVSVKTGSGKVVLFNININEVDPGRPVTNDTYAALLNSQILHELTRQYGTVQTIGRGYPTATAKACEKQRLGSLLVTKYVHDQTDLSIMAAEFYVPTPESE